jgi:hypothetical protein
VRSPSITLLCDPVVVAQDDPANNSIIIEEFVWGNIGSGQPALYRNQWQIPSNEFDKDAKGTGWKKVTKVDLTVAPNPVKPPKIRILPRPKDLAASGGKVKESGDMRTPTPIRRLIYTPLQPGLPVKDEEFQ